MKPSANVPSQYRRQVYITNILAFIFALVTLGIFAIFYSLFGWIDTLYLILLVALLFFAVPVINRLVNYTIGRILFCLIPVWLNMFITIYFKLEGEALTYIVYFDSRFILMASTILPGIIFRLDERIQLLICLGSTSIFLLLYDPIHEFFGAGYYQRGFQDPSYQYINYIVSVTYLVLLFGILLLRSVMEKSESNLKYQNDQLQEKQNEIEAQHEEMLQQQEEVLSSSEKLEEANRVIMLQQSSLEKYNRTLQALVEEKSHDLMRTNEELIKHNSELLQFSYTVSHNLRGPVARLLGLTRLFRISKSEEETQRLQDLIVRSGEELDEILKDLSLIIDIRNDLYKVMEKIWLEEEWKKAINLLGENVKSVHRLEVDFSSSPYVFGVRPMIQSIFYNLISNAIKYQSPQRKLSIKVHSYKTGNNKTVVEVIDNGLGIDLASQGKNVFKLYKRFHSHVGGKGLGLYLVKTQAEAMAADITVQSEVDKGTCFRLTFTQPETAGKQIFHDSDAAQLYFDAYLNITVVIWKRNVTSEEYRETFEVLLSSLKKYNTPGWVADIRNQGKVREEDQRWFAQQITNEAVKYGLKRVAVIAFQENIESDYYQRMSVVARSIGVEVQVFGSMEESLMWIKSLSEVTPDGA